ncbi:MAG: aspartate aminotransferase family protein [Pseudomonadota bacterium]
MDATPERSVDEWQDLDHHHHMHPFTDHRELGERRTRLITRADGVYIYDADGRQILDAMSGLWNVNVGYGRQEIVDAATRQLAKLPYYNSFFQCTNVPAVDLSALLNEISPPQFEHVFFAGSGSEANDTVMRMVRTYWDLMGYEGKHTFIARKNAYHGSTVGAASLGGMAAMHKQGGLPIPGVEHIEQPYWFDSDRQQSPADFGLAMARELERAIERIGADQVAAFIGEPVQGAGGVIIPPSTYWPEIQRICRKHNVLMVCDEVITGFGRLGEWFGATYYGVEPDLISFAKGVTSGYLPLGGVLVSKRVAQVLTERAGEFAHGYTYSGHPASCAVAIANLDIIRREGLVERIRDDIGPYLQERWAQLGQHPLVGEMRMVGLMGALELVQSRDTLERFPKDVGVGTICRDNAIEAGIVMRAVGDTMVVAPPFPLTHGQADELVNRAATALDATMAAVF